LQYFPRKGGVFCGVDIGGLEFHNLYKKSYKKFAKSKEMSNIELHKIPNDIIFGKRKPFQKICSLGFVNRKMKHFRG
jgi:hypothetical protein